uniref:Uncharacterized protein n=1 Tax=viral metagenome TaxID=1070528 RepID=A0A6C0C7S3_9ZZZZ
MNNKEQIQKLLEIMKVQGRKPALVEKMRELMIQRSFKPTVKETTPNTYKSRINTNKPKIPYPSIPPHIRRRT